MLSFFVCHVTMARCQKVTVRGTTLRVWCGWCSMWCCVCMCRTYFFNLSIRKIKGLSDSSVRSLRNNNIVLWICWRDLILGILWCRVQICTCSLSQATGCNSLVDSNWSCHALLTVLLKQADNFTEKSPRIQRWKKKQAVRKMHLSLLLLSSLSSHFSLTSSLSPY